MRPIIALALAASAALAGPLSPPPGPPAPTNKTLQQVEPRTPVSGFGLITQPGSYYLTQNIDAAGQSAALLISAIDVDLDLNGFTIAGDSTDAAIVILPADPTIPGTVTIRNGSIRDFANGAVSAAAPFVILRVTNVHAIRTGSGFFAEGPAHFTDSSVALTQGPAFHALGKSTATNCIARSAGDPATAAFLFPNGGALRNCVSFDSPGDAFTVQRESHLDACVALASGRHGFDATASALTNCHALDNDGHGFLLRDRTTLTHSTAGSNGLAGADILGSDNRITHSTFRTNGRDAPHSGIQILGPGSRNLLEANMVSRNTQHGIEATSVQNIIIRNFAFNQGPTSFFIGPGNVVGPTLEASAMPVATNPYANLVDF